MTQQLAAAVTSPGLFKEWVTTETPGRLPLGPVVLLGQLSGRPVVLVCVCVHICVSVDGHSKDSAGRHALIFLAHYLNEDFIVWFGLLGCWTAFKKMKGQSTFICQVV